jgi:hypothetical protein
MPSILRRTKSAVARSIVVVFRRVGVPIARQLARRFPRLARNLANEVRDTFKGYVVDASGGPSPTVTSIEDARLTLVLLADRCRERDILTPTNP